MRENVKIVLLLVIAGAIAMQTYMLSDKKPARKSKAKTTTPTTSISNPASPDNALALDANPNPAIPADGTVETPVPTGPTTTISFKESKHDFGNIKQKTENNHVFTFTNTGDEPLIISNAKGSCGCTVPEYPKQPIPPGETGEIIVKYSPGKQKGSQTKTVTITANTDPEITRLTISAEVEEVPDDATDPAGSAPEIKIP